MWTSSTSSSVAGAGDVTTVRPVPDVGTLEVLEQGGDAVRALGMLPRVVLGVGLVPDDGGLHGPKDTRELDGARHRGEAAGLRLGRFARRREERPRQALPELGRGAHVGAVRVEPVLDGEAVDDGDHEHRERAQVGRRVRPGRVEAAHHGLAVAVVERRDPLPQVGVAQRVREDVEERLEALGVRGDARLAVDQRPHAGLCRRHGRRLLDEAAVGVVRERVHQRRDEARLVAEVVADARLGLAGLAGDGGELERLEPAGREQALRSREDPLRGRGSASIGSSSSSGSGRPSPRARLFLLSSTGVIVSSSGRRDCGSGTLGNSACHPLYPWVVYICPSGQTNFRTALTSLATHHRRNRVGHHAPRPQEVPRPPLPHRPRLHARGARGPAQARREPQGPLEEAPAHPVPPRQAPRDDLRGRLHAHARQLRERLRRARRQRALPAPRRDPPARPREHRRHGAHALRSTTPPSRSAARRTRP